LNRNVHILINKLLGDVNFFEILYIFLTLKPLQYTNNYNLLDYGCGNGNVLALLQPVANKIGIRNLVGTDPYLPNNNYNNKDIKLFKTDLLESKAVMKLNKRFDYIILNHSLEHLTRPLLILKPLRKIIKKDGFVLIRTPLVDSYTFKKYKEYWFNLDAPSHINIFTKKSIKKLAKASKFRVIRIIYDSTATQFIFSK